MIYTSVTAPSYTKLYRFTYIYSRDGKHVKNNLSPQEGTIVYYDGTYYKGDVSCHRRFVPSEKTKGDRLNTIEHWYFYSDDYDEAMAKYNSFKAKESCVDEYWLRDYSTYPAETPIYVFDYRYAPKKCVMRHYVEKRQVGVRYVGLVWKEFDRAKCYEVNEDGTLCGVDKYFGCEFSYTLDDAMKRYNKIVDEAAKITEKTLQDEVSRATSEYNALLSGCNEAMSRRLRLWK